VRRALGGAGAERAADHADAGRRAIVDRAARGTAAASIVTRASAGVSRPAGPAGGDSWARRLYVAAAAGLFVLLGVLHGFGGREATLALTGALGPTAPLGLAYVTAWLLAVALGPTLLLGAAIDGALARLRRPRGG
jgi:hypothetical protein